MGNIIILLLVVTALCYVLLAVVACLKRPVTPSARFYAAMVLLAAIWAITCAAELKAPDLSTKILISQVRLMFICFIPLTWLGLVVSLTGRLHTFRKVLLFLLIVPAITAVLAITTRMHNHFRYDYAIETINGVSLLTFQRSAWDTFHEVSNHLVSLLGFFFLLSAWHSSSGTMRKQATWLGISFIIPLAANILFITKVFPSIGINPTPLAMLPSSLIQVWVILRTRLLDIIPIARSMVLQQIDIGILVLDQNGRIADVNRAALSMIGASEVDLVGTALDSLSPPWNTLNSMEENRIIEMGDDGQERWFQMDRKQIIEESSAGNLLLIKDITADVLNRQNAEAEQALKRKESQQRLQSLLLRDIHDGIGGLISNLSFMSVLASKAQDPAKKDEWLRKIEQTAAETNSEICDLMNVLENTSMNWADLIASIRRTVGILFDPALTVATVKVGRVPVDDTIGITEGMSLLRMVRECFNNIVKHARADQVKVQIDARVDLFTIVICDNGTGFNPDQITPGRGLRNLRARASELGGRIITRSDDGTCQTIEIPMPVRIVSANIER